MKIFTSTVVILSLALFISYSTVIVAQPPSSQRIDRIDIFYHGHQQQPSPEEYSSQVEVKTLDEAATLGEALPLKKEVKGPADLGIYFINSAGRSCGGLTTGQCSQDCGKLIYPVYWCQPRVCLCHYGTSNQGGDELEPHTF